MTGSNTDSMADDARLNPDQSQSVRRARLDNLYRQVSTAAGVNIVLAGVIVWISLDVIPVFWLLVWWALIAVINAMRTWMGNRYRRAQSSEHAPGLRDFAVLTLASGTAWGLSAPLFIAQTSHLEQQFILLIVMAGLAAGAIPFLAVALRLYLAYVAVLLGPSCAWLLFDGDPQHATIGLTGLVFSAALASAARNYAENFHRSQVLASALSTAKSRTEQANTELRRKIAETMEMQDALRASERRFQTAFEQAPIGIALLDPQGCLIQANPLLADLLGYPVDELPGRRIGALVLDDDRFDLEKALDPLLKGRESRARSELRFVRADGEILWASLAMAAVDQQDDNETYFILQVQDITESVEMSARLQYEAAHDELTGFVNRREFERRLSALLATRHAEGMTHTLCYLDLDRFKRINDSEGHVAGDEVLRQVATIVHDHIRGGDTIARIGGDEFAILLEHCDAEAACRIAETLVEKIKEFHFCWNGKIFRLDVSIGVASIESDHHNTADILRVADTACAAAKEAGGARVHVYRANEGETRRRQGETEWIGMLTEALKADAFVLHAQPIVPAVLRPPDDALRIEILVRLRDAAGRLLLPGTFLPAAERYGLAPHIDRWVIDALFAWLEANPDCAKRMESCAVNVAGVSLSDTEFIKHLIHRIHNTSIAPDRLQVEITESAIIGHLAEARHFMKSIGALGCRFALDDFGSGLSSFGYLRSLPVNVLKIDGQFVRDVVEDRLDRALVKSIVEVGRVLGLTTTAKAVENEATLEALREIGVDHVQGFCPGPPRPLAELVDATVATTHDLPG